MFSAGKGMSWGRAGRILAAIFLVGLALVPFFGEISLKLAIVAIGGVLLTWLAIDCATEIRNPYRRRAWGTVVTIAIEYLVFAALVGVAMAYFVRDVLRDLDLARC